ncbi:type 2 isopentenyl-diphosphate Delta-isomerase [Lapidilactobacillus bayanensis]|uniref:type 2 isopentenyl-diphosphate Delta-isomerase n=1 Tax=Lapidilactobacillus bayanensis TaxID=2485998 RepID=UPI000F78DCED|nr:type 2 isopentenyl-diphosphate Delta-isomerase [Lapidilactobacillus bayanensis]
MTPSQQEQRKKEHIAIAERLYRQPEFARDQFADVRISHPSLPDTKLASVHLEQMLFNRPINYPIYINAMTGGTNQALTINQKLAQLAAHFKIPMAVGSMSILKHEPELAASFTVVRQQNPDGVVFANVGADHPTDFAEEMVQLLQADALQIHLNAAQEFAMPEGDQDYLWSTKLAHLQATIGQTTPLIAKEVGFGMNAATISQLLQLGLQNIDVSGISRTNFIEIENHRRKTALISDYSDFGLTVIESLLQRLNVQQALNMRPEITFASGGIRTPWQAVKCLALGGDLVGMSAYFLHLVLHHDFDEMSVLFGAWLAEFKGIFAMLGCNNVADLRKLSLILSPELFSFAQQTGLDWATFSGQR